MNTHKPMIESNDPRLTAYVLGELAPHEIAQIEDALKSSPELRAAVADIRQSIETISFAFQAEPSLQLSHEQKSELLAEAELAANTDVHSFAENVTPTVTGQHDRSLSRSTTPWIKIAVAAGLASLLLGGAYFFTDETRPSIAASDKPFLESTVEFNGSVSAAHDEGQFKSKDNDNLGKSSEQPPIKQREPTNEGSRFDLLADSASPPTASDNVRTGRPGTSLSKKREAKNLAYQTHNLPRSNAAPAGDAPSFDDMMIRNRSDMPELAKNSPAAALAKRERFSKAQLFSNDTSQLQAQKDAAELGNRFESDELPQTESQAAPILSAALAESELNLPSNSPMLVRAQQSIDRSTLASLNLKVVAQDTPDQLYNSPVRGILGGASEGQPIKVARQPAKDVVMKRNAISSPPTTFKLQISDQDAKRIVQILANQTDPLQQRKLSFDELIGWQESLRVVNRVANESNFNKDGIRGLKLATESTELDANKLLKQSRTSQDAALMLASKLRDRVSQRLDRYSNAPTDLATTKLDSIEEPSQDRIDALAGRSLNRQPAFQKLAAGDQPKAPVRNAKPTLASAQPSEGLRPNEFDFDYTQVIEQLQSNLEIRNQSVNSPPR